MKPTFYTKLVLVILWLFSVVGTIGFAIATFWTDEDWVYSAGWSCFVVAVVTTMTIWLMSDD